MLSFIVSPFLKFGLRRGLNLLCDQWESGQDVGEIRLSQSIEMHNHTIQFGAEFEYLRPEIYNDFRRAGHFQFDGRFTRRPGASSGGSLRDSTTSACCLTAPRWP